MKTAALLGLCALLTAGVGPVPVEDRGLTPKTPEQTAQSKASGLLDSSMPLYLWNEAQSRYEIHMIDLSTGQDVLRYSPFVAGESEFIGSNTLSPNGQKLAVVAANGEYCYPSGGGTACTGRADVLHIMSLADWQEVTATLSGKGWAGPIAFSPDTRQLALVFNEPKSSRVMFFDADTGELFAEHPIAFHPSLMEYTSNGATLMFYEQPVGSDPGLSKPDSPRVVFLDTRTREVKWEQELPNIVSGYWCVEKCDESHGEQTFVEWSPAVILSPTQNKIYIVHANEELLTTLDFSSRSIQTAEIREKLSWLDGLLALTADHAQAKGDFDSVLKAGALSQDGTRLYVIGQAMSATVDSYGISQQTTKSLGLEVIEVATGEKVMSADREGTRLKIMPDQVHLLLGSWGQGPTNILDVHSLQSVANLGPWDISAMRGKNGQQVILASQSGHSITRLAVLDPVTFHTLHSWSLPTPYASWISIP